MENKNEYYDLMNSRVDELQAELEKMKSEAYFHDDAGAKEFQNDVGIFEKKVDDARKHLMELKSKGDAAWSDMKEGVDHALSDLKFSFDKIVSRFK
ncbi:MAG: hypothetical protein V2I97_11935 [Desulfococcaceae bacterium]|jgi:hypothetical protein|nr:hypothetical protein [Desulfococcaceae bacterium]